LLLRLNPVGIEDKSCWTAARNDCREDENQDGRYEISDEGFANFHFLLDFNYLLLDMN
jgi:hypothetical protein